MASRSAEYGTRVFLGKVADEYLSKYGLSAEVLKDPSWTKDLAKADKIAAAILDWGVAEGATNFSHVFQPLGSVGVRHGVTGQLHNQLFTFGSDGKPKYKFSGEQLLRGETDGSSYPNGGLRSKLSTDVCSQFRDVHVSYF
jgi:glutamine synthetase